MLNVGYFNNQILRKYTTVFGTLFNDIYIQRVDSDGQRKQLIPVPVQHAGSSRTVAFDEKNPIKTKVQTQLPRISYNMTSISIAQDRATNPLHKNVKVLSSNLMKVQFVEVPYNLEYEVNIYAKTSDDAQQIVEQIIPYFRPDFFPTVNLIPEMDLKFDTRVILNSVTPNESYEGGPDDVKMVIWTMSFTINAFFFGPTSNQGVIKRTIVDLNPVPGSGPITGDEVDKYGRQSRITVQPGLTPDGKPTTNIEESIPYQDIEPTDDYGIITIKEDFADGKKRDPKTGVDK